MTKESGSFNEKLIRKLANILNETGLTEIEYEKEQCRIKVAKQQHHHNVTSVQPVVSTATEQNVVNPSPTPQPTTQNNLHNAIKAPMVGNIYLSPAPNENKFVQLGDAVKSGDTLLIIESMKVMNQIKSDKDGIVKEILVNDAEPVEFDQPLIVIE